ncbi:ComEA family DNA-binding protein [Umezakia ovalisporum]|jgi:DNA uptake protein ComE-like DNA-binding protein|uniref:ComEA family DNA-binding protein n=2 Tax=Umezakia ovalisporum TaxID=75695 RepID=A0AA43KER5_9CYAN|nr:ComEA family DNA-binding protein [Umezakia ovalisporum]MBI1240121.1 ComEA family DNA-binding protein [Nostoc sp. RI_552]MDH6056597.1 ComEA family DNA-binding protein [Umezakia ovalisporum FSS-43]MDH6063283.1 ComEA family DNA-binding protein [Umezakia ovalisporum FSS-62]MDH6066222.1 ComEA family DNA-binding protein [Umezakia ovalisporum APH033B]MDH6070472.1 ComEA family DNA-binding protein [Umezakia ovalisporum CobakiLakeA]
MNWLPLNPKLQKLRAKLLNDPYYRLQSGEEIQLAVKLGIRIDANQATVDDWLRLPGLSIHQARSLVELSRSGVKFYCIEDVAAALAIPTQRLEPLRPLVSFIYYDEESLDCPTQLVNLNTATVEQLVVIPFIDVSLAEAVVQNRLSAGLYRNLADFQRRLNLPGEVMAQLMYFLRF